MAGCIPKPRDQMRSQSGAWERGKAAKIQFLHSASYLTQLAAYSKVLEIIISEETEVFAEAPIFRCLKVYRWQVGLMKLLFPAATMTKGHPPMPSSAVSKWNG